MELKTLLITAPVQTIPIYNQLGPLDLNDATPPLGLLYLAAILEKANYPVKVVDVFDYSLNKIEELVKREKPDIIGITCLTETRVQVLKVAEFIKKINQEIIIVLGGPHANYFPAQLLQHYSQVDYVVIGEGEYSFLELVRALSERKPLGNIEGIAFRDDRGEVIVTKERKNIQNLDELPFPSHHLTEYDRYVPAGIDPVKWKKDKGRYASVMTSRGCPYRCTYCSTTIFWGVNFRARSPKNVVDEIELLYDKYHVTHLGFFDDIFSARMERSLEICKEIVNRNIKISWGCITRVNFVKPDLIEWMKRAGCDTIFFGVESLSQKILNNIKKYAKPEQSINAFNLCKKVGIRASMGLMVGNTGENEETVSETLRVMKQVDPPSFNCSIMSIFPDTEMYEVAKKQNFITDDYWLTDKASPIYTVENSLTKLKYFRSRIQLSYYWHKKNYFLFFIVLFKRYGITNVILESALGIKKMLRIKSFGFWRIFDLSLKDQPLDQKDVVLDMRC